MMDQNQTFKTKPFDHQLEGITRSNGKTAFAWTAEQGTGKSWMLTNDVARLWGQGQVTELLILAPNGVHTNWVLNELPAHMPDWVRWRAVDWRASGGKKHQRFVESIMEPRDDTSELHSGELRILAMNCEAIQSGRGQDFSVKFCTSAMHLMIALDEAHRFKNPSSVRSKFLMKKLRPHSPYRRLLSGTITTESPFDLYLPYSFLTSRILGTTSFYAFKAEHADFLPKEHRLVMDITRRTGRVPQIVDRNKDGTPKYKNLEKLQQLIAPHTFRVLKKDCLDLPEKVYTQSYFELEPAQSKAYEKMREEARIVLENETETAVSKLTAVMKLSQISSGFVMEPVTKNVIPVCVKNPKLALLLDRLDNSIAENGNSVIIFCRFIEEINQIAAALDEAKLSHREYYGAVSGADRVKAINDFQAGLVDIILCQIDAASEGLTLHRANHVFYYSNTFSARARWQSEDRAHRIGQKRSVLYEDLLGLGTNDGAIVNALRNKKDIADVINGDLL